MDLEKLSQKNKIKQIKEVCAISTPDKLEGERILIFCTIKNLLNKINLESQIRKIIKQILEHFAYQKKFIF